MRRYKKIIIFLAFFLYSWIEFKALLLVAGFAGGLLAFIGVFLTAGIGIYLIRHQSKRVFSAWQKEVANNKLGLARLAEGLSILLGGFLMIIPGYATDTLGIICMIPILRTIIGSLIIANFADARLFVDLRGRYNTGAHNTGGNTGGNTGSANPNDATSIYSDTNITIDGDFTEKE